jgi:hypothetical protein
MTWMTTYTGCPAIPNFCLVIPQAYWVIRKGARQEWGKNGLQTLKNVEEIPLSRGGDQRKTDAGSFDGPGCVARESVS